MRHPRSSALCGRLACVARWRRRRWRWHHVVGVRRIHHWLSRRHIHRWLLRLLSVTFRPRSRSLSHHRVRVHHVRAPCVRIVHWWIRSWGSLFLISYITISRRIISWRVVIRSLLNTIGILSLHIPKVGWWVHHHWRVRHIWWRWWHSTTSRGGFHHWLITTLSGRKVHRIWRHVRHFRVPHHLFPWLLTLP